MKNLNYIIALLSTVMSLNAQTVKLKKEIVYINNASTFNFAIKSMSNELYIYKLDTKEELVRMIVDNNKTESKVDDSEEIIFTNEKITIASKNFRSRDFEFLISLLIEEKVINLKGQINSDNLIRFKAKYDERSINHTMR